MLAVIAMDWGGRSEDILPTTKFEPAKVHQRLWITLEKCKNDAQAAMGEGGTVAGAQSKRKLQLASFGPFEVIVVTALCEFLGGLLKGTPAYGDRKKRKLLDEAKQLTVRRWAEDMGLPEPGPSKRNCPFKGNGDWSQNKRTTQTFSSSRSRSEAHPHA